MTPREADLAAADLAAAQGLGMLALAFTAQAETWPVFLAWARAHEDPGGGLPRELTRGDAMYLAGVLGAAMRAWAAGG